MIRAAVLACALAACSMTPEDRVLACSAALVAVTLAEAHGVDPKRVAVLARDVEIICAALSAAEIRRATVSAAGTVARPGDAPMYAPSRRAAAGL